MRFSLVVGVDPESGGPQSGSCHSYHRGHVTPKAQREGQFANVFLCCSFFFFPQWKADLRDCVQMAFHDIRAALVEDALRKRPRLDIEIGLPEVILSTAHMLRHSGVWRYPAIPRETRRAAVAIASRYTEEEVRDLQIIRVTKSKQCRFSSRSIILEATTYSTLGGHL